MADRDPFVGSREADAPTSPIVTNISPSSSPLASPIPTSLLPGKDRSLAGISLRAFLLGFTLSLGSTAATILAVYGRPIWRAPFFLAALSLFHFLEFYVTAAYNTQYADIDAFLLSRNGKAYNIAHSAAMAECITSSLFLPSWQAHFARPEVILLGFAMLFVGQSTRTLAMAHAGKNFNHTVQTRKASGHQLVTTGVYAYLRHPSYFGFFWWGLGTQVVLGNVLCFLGYTGVLWMFFSRRIRKEEELLLDFFGRDYLDYKTRTRVGIPLIP